MLAIDEYRWIAFPDELTRFQTLCKRFELEVETAIVDVDQPFDLGQFDVVLFLQVLYHLQNPVLALKQVCNATKKWLLVDSMVLGSNEGPAELRVFWSVKPVLWPNAQFVERLLALYGMKFVRLFDIDDTNQEVIKLGLRPHRMAWRCWR